MRRSGRFGRISEDRADLLLLLILATCFLAGMIGGRAAADRIPAAAASELSSYLKSYYRLEYPGAASAFWPAVWLYIRYPLAAFFLGMVSVGFFMIPCLTVCCGFFLSFSVCCYTAAFGQKGVLLAAAAIGLRCLITLPCYFYLATASLSSSAALAALSRGTKLPGKSIRFPLERFGLCLSILLLGVGLELALGPALIHAVLEHLF